MPTLKIEINTSGVVRAEKVIDKSFEGMEKSTKELSDSIKMLENTFKNTSRTLPATKKPVIDLKKEVGYLDKGVEELNKGLISSNTFLLKYGKSLSIVRKEVRETRGANAVLVRRLEEVSEATKKASENTSILSGFFKTIKAAALGYGTVLATMELSQFSKDLVTSGIELDSLRRSFKAITGSSTAAAQELQFVSKTAKDLGLDLPTLEKAYKGILAASIDTSLEGQKIRDVFLSISKASAVLGLDTEQTEGALRALSQMISKGNVQAEELRGQLGERLPGAFKIAAAAMGVSTRKLNDMLENGEVLAEDLLPKLAEELEKRFGKSAESAGESARAAFVKFGIAVEELKRTLSESGIVQFFENWAKILTPMINLLNQALTLDERELKQSINLLNTKIEIAKTESARNKFIEERNALIVKLAGLLRDLPEEGVVTKPIIYPEAIESSKKELVKLRKELNLLISDGNKAKKALEDSLKPGIIQTPEVIILQNELREAIRKGEEAARKYEETFDKTSTKVKTATQTQIDALKKLTKEQQKANKEFDKFFREVQEFEDALEKATMKDLEKELDSFFGELERMEDKFKEDPWSQYKKGLEESVNTTQMLRDYTAKAFQSMEDSLAEFILTGEVGFKDLANTIIAEMTRAFVRGQIIKPLVGMFEEAGGWGGVLKGVGSLFGFAEGGVVSGKNISNYSNQVVSTPTIVPNTNVHAYANGGALFGEAGPEAIMPLTRTSTGELGVKAEKSQPVVNINIENNRAQDTEITTTDPIFDAQGRMTIGVIIDAMTRNVNGLGDVTRRVARQV